MNKPLTPTVLLVVTPDSKLRVMQDLGVRIAFIDLRVERDYVTLLPERNQALEIDAFLRPFGFVSLREDIGETAANAFAQIIRQRLTVGTLEPDAIQVEPTSPQEAQR